MISPVEVEKYFNTFSVGRQSQEILFLKLHEIIQMREYFAGTMGD